jgi:hypothetical protein
MTWRRQGSGIDAFTITIPDGLCPPSAQFIENTGQGTMTATTALPDDVIQCAVVNQSTTLPSAFPFNFSTHPVQQTQTSRPAPQSVMEQKKGGGKPPIHPPVPPIPTPFIAGSCQGCGSATGRTGDNTGQTGRGQAPPGGPTPTVVTPPTSGHPTVAPGGSVATPATTLQTLTQPPYYITCLMVSPGQYQASVAPIVIPSTQTVNNWTQNGLTAGSSVQFPADKNPCSNDNSFANGASCYLKADAAANSPYTYTAHLVQCPYGGSPADGSNFSFTVTP